MTLTPGTLIRFDDGDLAEVVTAPRLAFNAWTQSECSLVTLRYLTTGITFEMSVDGLVAEQAVVYPSWISQATRDAIITTERHIRDERTAIATLQQLGLAESHDYQAAHRFLDQHLGERQRRDARLAAGAQA